ncbi:hypothetical protein [Micromonospora craniellae]|uniref:hypothetical protein n=1 Tax=Micromonospora craniellae TaxID=2294034 RepID=UPI001CC7E783|nr:hypothetical protein [Micromonospora craniellae]
MAPPGEEVYVAATLARGLKYRSRADATRLTYQAHPIRRDFLLTFDPSTEQELVNGVASVTESVPGVPKVAGMWIGARAIGKQVSATGTPVQRFLYKEFYRAWKRAGR